MKKKCFVIMPFSDTRSCTEQKWTEIFEYIIKPAVEESRLGYECERSVAERENIVKGILEGLNKANVVIADLTDNNPNVFYELGVRHTLANCTILIAQGKEHIPFDLRPYPVAFYGESPAKIAAFKRDIKKKLKDIERNPERSDNPVADFLKERNIELLSSEKKRNLARLSALMSELSFNITSVGSILDTVAKSEQIRKEQKNKYYTSYVRFDNACLELLLSTQYIILPKPLMEEVRHINFLAGLINNNLDSWGKGAPQDTEKILKEELPYFKNDLLSLLKDINKVRIDYVNDNYREPKMPILLLSIPEHQEYLEITKQT